MTDKQVYSFSSLTALVREKTAMTDNFRHLTQAETKQLKDQGNRCADWNQILVADDFSPAGIELSVFAGTVRIGSMEGTRKENSVSPEKAGITGSYITGCIIPEPAFILNSVLSGCLVCGGARIVSSPEISCTGTGPEGCGLEISVGNELAGRSLIIHPELSFGEAAALAMHPSDETLHRKNRLYAEELRAMAPALTVIGPSAVVKNSTVRNSVLYPGTVLDGASAEDSVIISSEKEKTCITSGSIVRNCIIQQGCTVSDMALAENSLICSHTSVSRHGKVTSSVAGPDSVFSEGEVTSCLAGPFTGFHHQALLIAALWPEGKGNVGYGANAGSNHTGKAPDQELICGEGLFIGLGTSLKFPADYSSSPYSIIATGVCTQPQKTEFPFSLINSPGKDPEIPAGCNEIVPAWVLKNDLYFLVRNEKKFLTRNRSGSPVKADVFRPEIMDMVLEARNRLMRETGRKIYTSGEIPGLGKNYLTEKNRISAIETYTFFINCYCGKILWKTLSGIQEYSLNALSGPEPVLSHALRLLVREGKGSCTLKEILQEYAESCLKNADSLFRSKERDDIKGRDIIPDYDAVTLTADRDPLIQEYSEKAESSAAEIRSFTENHPDLCSRKLSVLIPEN